MIKLERKDSTWHATIYNLRIGVKLENTFASSREALRWAYKYVSCETL